MTTPEFNNKRNSEATRTYKTDPQYFGGYLNMARHNVFTISNYIADKLKILDENENPYKIDDEGKIGQSFLCNNNLKNIDWDKVFNIALRFLPVVKVFDFERLPEKERKGAKNTGIDIAALCKAMEILFKELSDFRNDYSHYYSTATQTTRKTIVSSELAKFLTENYKRAIEYTQLRFKDTFIEDDFSLAKAIPMVDANNKVTEYGFVFLISMFLEREDAFHFITKIKGIKGTQYKSFRAVQAVLTVFCITLPHDKLISDDPKQALMLDMINELNKCPKTLYRVIAEEAKKEFQPQLEDPEIKNGNVIEVGSK